MEVSTLGKVPETPKCQTKDDSVARNIKIVGFPSTTTRSDVARKSKRLPFEASLFLNITRLEGKGQALTSKAKCNCCFDSDQELMMKYEVYHPRTVYTNSNVHSKSSSRDMLRQMLTDRGNSSKRIGRPTALSRLVNMMQKHPPPPLYKYGNCLQQTLNFDERKMKYEFIDRIIYQEPEIDEIFVDKKPVFMSKRKNPFAAVQLCPTSMFQRHSQPPGQEYVSRKDHLMDILALGLDKA
ncbi:hypothetical protein GE061_010209 [Apolygus lucorum]|uniref:Uncharacterized protein n=1 Tax=Apolygus lucorum TaxID=248454 RepID=A0A8S9Y537_APOLU|nr:hypothetical protein GE061_010209 [Apolygus lucorum]